jgi:hypothetical protein
MKQYIQTEKEISDKDLVKGTVSWLSSGIKLQEDQ